MTALAATGCNSDIFVPDTRPSEPEISLPGDGGEASVRFHPAGLRRIRLENELGECGDCFNAEGELVASDTPSEVAMIVYRTDWQQLCVDVDGNVLTFRSVENSSEAYTLWLRLEYESTIDIVTVNVEPGAPFELVEAVYETQVRVDDKFRKSSTILSVNNDGDSPLSVTVRPYQSVMGEAVVKPRDLWAIGLEVNMPMLTRYGDRWRIGEERPVRLGEVMRYEPQYLDRDCSVTVEVPPGRFKVITTVMWSSATAGCILDFVNPVTGYKFFTLAECQFLEPISYEVKLAE